MQIADRDLDQITNDRFDVAADVSDFGELGCLDLYERRVDDSRDPASDLGLADAGWPDHEDVLGMHLAAQLFGSN